MVQTDLFKKKLNRLELLQLRRKEAYQEVRKEIIHHKKAIVTLVKNYRDFVKKIDEDINQCQEKEVLKQLSNSSAKNIRKTLRKS